MQVYFQSLFPNDIRNGVVPYDADMRGRPSKQPRSGFGERLFHAREEAGLSQQQLAEKLGVSQQDVARWERETIWFNIELLSKLALILDVSADELVGLRVARVNTKPVGKARQLFEAVSKLPRRQQEKIGAVVEAFVNQHSNGHKQAA